MSATDEEIRTLFQSKTGHADAAESRDFTAFGKGAGGVFVLIFVGAQILLLFASVLRALVFNRQRRRARRLEKRKILTIGADATSHLLEHGGDLEHGDMKKERVLRKNPRCSISWMALSYYTRSSNVGKGHKIVNAAGKLLYGEDNLVRRTKLFTEKMMADGAAAGSTLNSSMSAKGGPLRSFLALQQASSNLNALDTRVSSSYGPSESNLGIDARDMPLPATPVTPKFVFGETFSVVCSRHISQPTEKAISAPLLKQVTGIVNPDEMCAIMGPSGSGKSTLMDMLAGRRNEGFYSGVRAACGVPYAADDHAAFPLIDHRKFKKYSLATVSRSSGYVKQFGAPYFETLTARENLAYAAVMRLEKHKPSRARGDHSASDGESSPKQSPTGNGRATPGDVSFDEDILAPPKDVFGRKVDTELLKEAACLDYRLRRVTEVLFDTGLSDRADVVLGGTNSQGGLSGGQKRRLAVAIELLRDPAVLFMDEPTSGLDSASSLLLISMLHTLTKDHQRTIMITIHQPRIEIFTMFDKVALLVKGFSVFFGTPANAISDFMDCVHDMQLSMFDANNDGEVTAEELQQALDETNPADIVMDVLTEANSSSTLLDWLVEKFDQETRPGVDEAISRALQEGPERLVLKSQRPSFLSQLWAITGRFYLGISAVKAILPIITAVLAGLVFGLMFRDRIDGHIMAAAMYKAMLAAPIFAPFVVDNITTSLEVIPDEASSKVAPLVLYVVQFGMHFAFFGGLASTALYTIEYSIMFDKFVRKDYLESVVIMWQFAVTHAAISMAVVLVFSYLMKKPSTISLWAIGCMETFFQLFSGFFLPYGDAPRLSQLCMLINPEFWAFSALMKINLRSQSDTCVVPPPPAPIDPVQALTNQSYVIEQATIALRGTSERAVCLARSPIAVLSYLGYSDVEPYEHALMLCIFWFVAVALSTLLIYKPWKPRSPVSISGKHGIPKVKQSRPPNPAYIPTIRTFSCFTGVFTKRLKEKAQHLMNKARAGVAFHGGKGNKFEKIARMSDAELIKADMDDSFFHKKKMLVKSLENYKRQGTFHRAQPHIQLGYQSESSQVGVDEGLGGGIAVQVGGRDVDSHRTLDASLTLSE